jgi:peptidase E
MAQTRRHIKTALAATGVKKPLVAYVGAASDDHSGFQKMLSALILGSGARLEAAKLASPRAPVSAARQVLEDCHLVFVSGGDVERGMEVLRERDMVGVFRALALSGKPMLGLSAGSIMLGRGWVRFPDDDDARAEVFECLGVVPLHLDCHSEDDNWSELRVLARLLGRDGAEHLVYGLPSAGCLQVRLQDGEAELTARGAPIPRLRVSGGVTVDDTPLTPAG